MPVIKNVSPIGAVEVPLLRRIVEAAEEVEVIPAHASILLAQDANWQPVDPAAKAIAAEVLAPPPDVDEADATPPAGPPAPTPTPVDLAKTPDATTGAADAAEGAK